MIFLHQDIEFDSEETLHNIVEEVEKKKIVGVAGRKKDGGSLVTTIDDGINRERHHDYLFKKSSEEVLTCDECLIAMDRKVFEKNNGFDEEIFDGWHFYGIDFCLRANKIGIQACVVPTKIWHKSKGTHDKAWRHYENRLRQKYRHDYRVLYYPCGMCFTNTVLFYILRLLRPIRKIELQLKRKRKHEI